MSAIYRNLQSKCIEIIQFAFMCTICTRLYGFLWWITSTYACVYLRFVLVPKLIIVVTRLACHPCRSYTIVAFLQSLQKSRRFDVTAAMSPRRCRYVYIEQGQSGDHGTSSSFLPFKTNAQCACAVSLTF